MEMKIGFPGGVKVDARFKGFAVTADQPVHAGGEGASPAPFDYFLASIGTCAGYYVLDFLRHRELPTEGVHLSLSTRKHPESKMLAEITLKIIVPEGFPEKYHRALIRSVDLCAVKKHLDTPPVFRTTVEVAAPSGAGCA